jgi:hypothetical protein
MHPQVAADLLEIHSLFLAAKGGPAGCSNSSSDLWMTCSKCYGICIGDTTIFLHAKSACNIGKTSFNR